VIIFLMMWMALTAMVAACATQFELPVALMIWITGTAIACAGGTFLISRQPPGLATLGGRLGFAVVHWGFRASQGRLIPAAMISWLIWITLGTAAIAGAHFPTHVPIFVAWTGDLLGLFYVLGVMLANRSGRIPASLAKVVAALIALVAGSLFLWFRAGSDQARAIALAVAGGPPLLIGAMYGFVLVPGLLAGRSRHH
jgi:hypothetical protein